MVSFEVQRTDDMKNVKDLLGCVTRWRIRNNNYLLYTFYR